MEIREALKWATYYHALALVASVVGLGIVAAGAYVGLTATMFTLLDGSVTSAATWSAAVGAARPIPFGIALVVGLMIRRVGRTSAKLQVQSKAAAHGVDLPDLEAAAGGVGGAPDPMGETETAVGADDGSDPLSVGASEDDGYDDSFVNAEFETGSSGGGVLGGDDGLDRDP